MNTVSSLYKFYLTNPMSGFTEVFPKNNTLKWQWKREKDQTFYRKILSTELVFIGDEFKALHALDRNGYRCEKIPIEIHRKCGEGFEVFHSGFLALVDGDYDVSGCKMSIKVRNEDDYTCLLAGWQIEKDIIKDVAATDTIQLYEYTVESQECTAYFDHPVQIGPFRPEELTPSTACLDDPGTYAYNGIVTWNLESFNNTTLEEYWSVTWSYKRFRAEQVDEPEGGGWTEIDPGVWVKPFITTIGVLDVYEFENGRLLNDVIQYLIQDCGLSYVSNFFGNDPDATNPSNFAYDYASSYLQELVIFQKSDIRYPLKTEKATKGILTLKSLLEWLNTMYKVQWLVEGNTLRIEHYTYFQNRVNMLDLTQTEPLKRIAGRYKYKYVSEELPIKETWSWMEKIASPVDFDAGTIQYDSVCSFDGDLNTDEKSVPITTNVEGILADPTNIGDAGWVIMAKRGVGVLVSAGVVSGESRINMANSWANLLYYLHRHGRPQSTGSINGQNEQFFYTIPKRIQEGINVKMCCEDLATFDPMHKVRTQLGWGIVDTAELNDPQELITLNLLHNA